MCLVGVDGSLSALATRPLYNYRQQPLYASCCVCEVYFEVGRSPLDGEILAHPLAASICKEKLDLEQTEFT